MEKGKPSHNLAAFKAAFALNHTISVAAARSAVELGYEKERRAEVVAQMTRQHFYKSVTTYADHKQWQDVYHVPHDGRLLYLKFTKSVVTEFILLSFKEK
jgi:motility quorum-sensing regulator/GCU-specific mRNA interferase toxin